MDLTKTGLFISALRKQMNMTQKDLAERIGVTDKAVSRWETGRGFPDVSLLITLAETLGVSVSEIVTGEKIEIEEKKAVEIMNKMNQTVIDTLDYSQREIKKNKWKSMLTSFSILLLSGFTMFCVFMIVYDKMFWAQTPHVPINEVLYALLVYLAIPIGLPMLTNSIKDKQTWITPRKFLWLSPLTGLVFLMIATAIFFPDFYRDLFNVDALHYDFNDTAVDDVLFYLMPINLLIAISVTAICHAVNCLNKRKDEK